MSKEKKPTFTVELETGDYIVGAPTRQRTVFTWLVATAIGLSLLLRPAIGFAQVPTTWVAVRTQTSNPPPAAVNGIVTLTLESGATVRLRAFDIDYDRTSGFKTVVVIKALSAATMTAPGGGRKYLNIVFPANFVATVWLEDLVDEPVSGPASSPAVAATPAAASSGVTRSSSPSSSQCAATTQKRTRCLRTAAAGSAFCWQHK